MFVDEARVHVRGGRGGDGVIAFLREKFRPKGGPSGGDGGRGGHVVFVATNATRTLVDLSRQKKIAAPNGRPGSGRNRAGKGGEDRLIRVPPGTVIKDADTEETLWDLVNEGERAVVARGGRGGRGRRGWEGWRMCGGW